MRDLVLRGGPWTETERRDILDYCATDVDCLGPLLERMLPGIRRTRQGFGQALLRGRYAAAVARMEHTGIPIDVPTLDMLRQHWGDIKLGLIADIDKDYGVFEGTTFKAGLFASWLDAEGIAWPRTTTGRLQLDQDTFRDMAKAYPKLGPLKELRHALSEMRLEEIRGGSGWPQPHHALAVRCAHGAEYTLQHQVHLRAGGLVARPDQAGAGPGARLRRLEQSRSGDCGGPVGGRGSARRCRIR